MAWGRPVGTASSTVTSLASQVSDNASAPLVKGSRETSRAETAGRVALWIVFLAAAGFRWSVAGRGLDLTDESFALLAAGHPEEMRAWPSLFFGYTAPLFTLAGGDIALMRRLGLVLFLAAGAVLARGTARWLQGEPGTLKAGSLFTVVGLGSLVYYSRGISVPNYNHVTACGLAMGFGLLLVALRSEAGHGRLALIGSGFGLASAAASKPPAILALIAAGLWLIARRRSTGGLIWLLAGIATAWAVPLTIHSPRDAFDAVKTGVEVFQVRGDRYALGEALGVYAIQAFQLLGQTAA